MISTFIYLTYQPSIEKTYNSDKKETPFKDIQFIQECPKFVDLQRNDP